MAKKNFKKEEQNLENVQEALNTTSAWIEANQNKLTWGITVLVVIVLGIIALNTYVLQPKAQEASNDNAKATVYFMQGNYEVALNGDDSECVGFEQIANENKCSQEGKLAALYTGICYYQLGDYTAAAEYLSKFSADDLNIEPAALQFLGDAYVQLEEYTKAAKAFGQAAASNNEIIAPMSLKKLGFVQMELGNNKAAKVAFETIKNDYPMSAEAQDIEKYIAIVK
ncbi:MAG: tetratricopeptide repeat protein [Paludibacteraceae bacterium]|nr:tetratricopeptide repeat protein [Paludibacteraceae bacterium]